MGYPSNPVVTDIISTSSPVDTYATHWAFLGKGGLRTVATLADMNAIPTARREFGMKVAVIADPTPSNNKTYILANTALGGTNDTITDNANFIQDGASGSFTQTPITVAALQALIAGNLVSIGTQYAITDAQDSSSASDRVYVTGLTSNTVSGSGDWKRTTVLNSNGAIFLRSGTAGSIDQIQFNGVTNLMTASVPYTTSRVNTASLVVANINANSGVSGFTATLITGNTDANGDMPTIVVESVATGVVTGALVVTSTTLVTAIVKNVEGGRADIIQTLEVSYDITTDRIMSARDITSNNSIINGPNTISQVGHNPIKNFRWGDIRFENNLLEDIGWTNVYMLGGVASNKFSNNTIRRATYNLVIFNIYNGNLRTTTLSSTDRQSISNVSVRTITNIIGNLHTMNISATSIDANFTVSNNVGSAYTITLLLNAKGNYSITGNLSGSIAISSSFLSSATIARNDFTENGIIITASTFNAALSIQRNKLMRLSLTTTTFLGGLNIDQNVGGLVIINTVTIIPATTINISLNNIIDQISLSGCTLSTTTKSLTIITSTFHRIQFNRVGDVLTDLYIAGSTIGTSFNTGWVTSQDYKGKLIIENSSIGTTCNKLSPTSSTDFVITSSNIGNACTLGTTASLILTKSQILDGVVIGSQVSVSALDAEIRSSTNFINTSGGAQQFSIWYSTVSGVYTYDTVGTININYSTLTFANAGFFTILSTTLVTITNTSMSYGAFTIDTGGNDLIIDSAQIFNNSTFSLTTVGTIGINNLTALNSVISISGTTIDLVNVGLYNTILAYNSTIGAIELSDFTMRDRSWTLKKSIVFDGTAGGGQAGTPILVGQIPPFLNKKDVYLYTGGLIDGGGTATLSVGYGGTYDNIYPDTLISTLLDTVINDTLISVPNATDETVYINPEVEDITAGDLSVIISGHSPYS